MALSVPGESITPAGDGRRSAPGRFAGSRRCGAVCQSTADATDPPEAVNRGSGPIESGWTMPGRRWEKTLDPGRRRVSQGRIRAH